MARWLCPYLIILRLFATLPQARRRGCWGRLYRMRKRYEEDIRIRRETNTSLTISALVIAALAGMMMARASAEQIGPDRAIETVQTVMLASEREM